MRKKLYAIAIALSMNLLGMAQEPVLLEYFIDEDPGYGAANIITGISTGSNTLALDLTGIAPGAHKLHVRCQDNKGVWSKVVTQPLYVINSKGVKALEYFFDTDPGEGNGLSILIPTDQAGTFDFAMPTDGLPMGQHQLCVRAQDYSGKWFVVTSQTITIDERRITLEDITALIEKYLRQ
ncbi:MAG: hypothetical protein IJV06_05550 [Bacteroidaceae bacterium]|nr:hypothetical protein [Bacteroidaceae bacterium]